MGKMTDNNHIVIYTYVYIYIYIHTHVCFIYLFIYVYLQLYIYIYIYTYVFAYLAHDSFNFPIVLVLSVLLAEYPTAPGKGCSKSNDDPWGEKNFGRSFGSFFLSGVGAFRASEEASEAFFSKGSGHYELREKPRKLFSRRGSGHYFGQSTYAQSPY